MVGYLVQGTGNGQRLLRRIRFNHDSDSCYARRSRSGVVIDQLIAGRTMHPPRTPLADALELV